MNQHYKQGVCTRQAHKGIPEGCYEEEQGHHGFFGPVSYLIKDNPSTNWVEIEGNLRPRMFDLVSEKMPDQKQSLLSNSQLDLAWLKVRPTETSESTLYRCADGDLLLFCHKGSGILLSEYGAIPYRAGHYLLIPKCLTYGFFAEQQSLFLVIENKTSHFQEPDRGVLGRNALYDQQSLLLPDLDLQQKLFTKISKRNRVEITHCGQKTIFKYQDCVLSNVKGWKGDLYPFALHVEDIMPVMSHRAHLPPSVHTTFVARDFVVCTFLPRPLETDGDALKVPFYHQNIDYDEVIFYHDGDFFSRDNLHPGMMSFHPAGFPHGPHPKAVKNISKKTHTSEYAVMIDSRWPLSVGVSAEAVELKEYWKSWKS